MMAGESRLAAWDCRDKEWLAGQEPKVTWLRQHFPAEIRFIYRIEFYASDLGPRAKLYSYAPGSAGRRHWSPGHDARQPHDHRACYIAENPPRFVPLDELPPPDLLRAAA